MRESYYIIRRPQAADHRSQAADRRASGADFMSPRQMDMGRRSSGVAPWISKAFPLSNKNTSGSKAAEARKKETPPHLECDKCLAIWDGCRVIPFLFIIFNSTHTGAPSMHIYTSGIPSATRFSIRWQCVFFGKCFFSDCQRFFSVLDDFGIRYFPLDKSVWIGFPQFCQTCDNILFGHAVQLVDVLLFSPVNSQATQSGTNFFSVDCGRILSSLFCPCLLYTSPSPRDRG